jgi:hypothetical protein
MLVPDREGRVFGSVERDADLPAEAREGSLVRVRENGRDYEWIGGRWHWITSDDATPLEPDEEEEGAAQ